MRSERDPKVADIEAYLITFERLLTPYEVPGLCPPANWQGICCWGLYSIKRVCKRGNVSAVILVDCGEDRRIDKGVLCEARRFGEEVDLEVVAKMRDAIVLD